MIAILIVTLTLVGLVTALLALGRLERSAYQSPRIWSDGVDTGSCSGAHRPELTHVWHTPRELPRALPKTGTGILVENWPVRVEGKRYP